ncbi:hypothetical protein LTR95_013780, partial [Oleoguttula sp. CCFEE 5521]
CLRQVKAPGFDPKDPYAYKPDLEQLKKFMKNLSDKRNTRGRLEKDGPAVVSTIAEKGRQLIYALHIFGRHSYEKAVNSSIQTYVRKDLAPILSKLHRSKSVADHTATRDILQYLWMHDEHPFKHPQTRLNIALATLLVHYNGTRPGELVESSLHRLSGEGLTWEHIEFWLICDSNGRRLWGANIYELWRKGRRNMHSLAVIGHVREVSDRTKCPISLLFALGFARNVFATLTCPEDLEKIPTPAPGCAPHTLLLRPEMENAPVFQALERRGGHKKFSDNRMWDAGVLATMLKELGHRAGYEEPVTPYSFRRGFANEHDKKVPEALRKRLMGHTSVTAHTPYTAQICSVDTTGIMNNMDQEIELMRHLSCMRPVSGLSAKRGNLLARTVHGRSQTPPSNAARLFNSTKPSQTNKSVEEFDSDQCAGQPFSGYIEREPPSSELQSFLSCDAPRSRVIALLETSSRQETVPLAVMTRALLEVAMSDSQLHYPNVEPGDSLECKECGRTPGPKPDLERHNMHLLRCAGVTGTRRLRGELWEEALARDPACRWLGCDADLWWAEWTDHSAILDHFETHLRGQRSCKWDQCDAHEFDSEEALQRHLWVKHGIPLTDDYLCSPEYCFRCQTFVYKAADWERHCQYHLDNLQLECGLVVRTSVIIKAGYCPFCATDKALAPSTRYAQFTKSGPFMLHIRMHVRHADQTLRCPFDVCDTGLLDPAAFYDHIAEAHGIGFKDPTYSRTATAAAEAQRSITKYFRCKEPDCFSKFHSSKALLQHRVEAHDFSAYSCKLMRTKEMRCAMIFENSAKLTRHQTTHIKAVRLACSFPGCNYRTKGMRPMAVHMKSHEGDTPYVCQEQARGAKRSRCRNRFATAEELSTHVRSCHRAKSAKARVEMLTIDCGRADQVDMLYGSTFDDPMDIDP